VSKIDIINMRYIMQSYPPTTSSNTTR